MSDPNIWIGFWRRLRWNVCCDDPEAVPFGGFGGSAWFECVLCVSMICEKW
jgi:hypothetical protein